MDVLIFPRTDEPQPAIQMYMLLSCYSYCSELYVSCAIEQLSHYKLLLQVHSQDMPSQSEGEVCLKCKPSCLHHALLLLENYA